MLFNRCLLPVATLTVAAILSGCGSSSGEGGGNPPGAVNLPPASGTYAWVLKAQGPTDALRFGLSLVHPAAPTVEYLIESASINVTDAKVVSSGTVDAAGQRITGVQPYALIYIVGGDVRRVPLIANGQLPGPQVQRAQTTSACSFELEANDHAMPERSRYVVSTAGADGQCGSADDGRAEVRLDSTVGLLFTPFSTNSPLGVLRDPASLAPRGWITPTTATFWSPSPGSTVTLRDASKPAIAAVVSNGWRSAVVESVGGGLSVLDFPGGDAFTEAPLIGPAGSGWQPIGYDANNFYVYQNTVTAGTVAWQIYAIGRSALPTARLLSNGLGEIALASMGSNLLYLTVLGATNNQLLALTKSAPASSSILETLGTSDFISLSTSNSGVHQLWRVTGVGAGTAGYTVEFVDEVFNKLYTSPAGGWPLGAIEATAIDLNTSENRSRFVFATGFTTQQTFNGAALVGYDTTGRTATSLGTLPGAGDFGINSVYADVVTGPTSSAAGFAARADSGVVQDAGSRVFSFDAATAGSLTLTTTQQP